MTVVLWSWFYGAVRWLYFVTLSFYKNDMKNQKFSEKVLKVLHKFNRFDLREKVFLVYLIVLFFALLFPIITITSLRWWAATTRFCIWNKEFLGTMLVVLLSFVVLFWWNLSVKFKNLFSTYFGWKENDSLINFLFLFIIITVFLSIKNTVNIASNATSTISFTSRWIFILILLLVGIVFTLVSVVKWAQQTWKKAKIINIVDEDHNQLESTKDEIKKWLFNEEEMKN